LTRAKVELASDLKIDPMFLCYLKLFALPSHNGITKNMFYSPIDYFSVFKGLHSKSSLMDAQGLKSDEIEIKNRETTGRRDNNKKTLVANRTSHR
jgi:hypothetical protein